MTPDKEQELQGMARTARNDVSLILSIVPGAGHLYKGHYREGVTCLALVPVVLFASLIAGPMTLGFSLLLVPAYWIGVGAHAFQAEDARKHHWMPL